MIKIGLIGCGIIGNTLKNWIKENNSDVEVFVNDPVKGYNDDIYSNKMDAYFIQIHLPTENDGNQNQKTLTDIIRKIPRNIPIWIRTTILPTTLKAIQNINSDVNFMPEFLTERTCQADFNAQPIIFTGTNEHIDILKKIFKGKKYTIMTNDEACIVKYAHNVFGALKVTYFNCIYDICENMGLSYENVLKGILLSGYINKTHTEVPGPDGERGYGGKCFPKDVNAFSKYTEQYKINKLIKHLKEINNVFRNN